ncbi:MAG: hypothetical protein LKE44_11380 [Eubacterium sp.]|jgi:hypothetical protein|nr:hypothetical protein [Eubacterium sp.]
MTKEERKRKIEKALDVDFTEMTRQEVEEYALKAAEQSVLNEAEADHWRELYQREVNRKYGRSRDTADIDYAQLSFLMKPKQKQIRRAGTYCPGDQGKAEEIQKEERPPEEGSAGSCYGIQAVR